MFDRIEAVLFDLDGTLIDSAPDLAAAADSMRVSRGLQSLPLDSYRHMAGAGARGMLGIALNVSSADPMFEKLRDEFFERYQHCLTQRTLAFNGVADMLQHLHTKQIPWGVVTNKAARFTEPLTKAMPLFATASTVVSGDTTPYAKPHPEPLLEAARRMGVSPARCVYVGDDQRDIEAGLAAGMVTVAANYGYLGEKANPASWGAHARINSPMDLLQLLAKA